MGIIDVSKGVKYLQEQGIPVFKFPENTAKAFGALYRYANWLNRQQLAEFDLVHDRERAAGIIADCRASGRHQIGELEGIGILEAYGFKVLPTRLATSGKEAAAIAKEIGFPVVLKIVSPQILHKSDAGGVIVNLTTEKETRDAYKRIVQGAKDFDPQAKINGVLVQQMAPAGREVILGLNRYPVFGPLLMFGIGGIFVEVFQDVTFRLAPIGRNAARRMVREIKGYKLLQEFRGRPKADIERIEKLLVSLSAMSINHPEIMELDINPLLVHADGKGATAADCRIILKQPEGRNQ
jgi:acetyltransferase